VRKPLLVAAACVVLFVVPARAEAGDGKKLLPLLSERAEMVALFDIADARDAATFDTLLDNAPAKLADLVARLTAAGLDARQDVDTMLIASHGEAYQVVLEGRIGKDQLAGLVAGGSVEKHRGVRYWAGPDTEVAMLGKRLVLTSSGEMTGVIDRHKKKGRSLMKSPDAAAIRGLIALIDARHDVWIAAFGSAVGSSDTIEGMALGMTFGADLAVEVRAQLADTGQLDMMKAALDAALPQLVQQLEQVGLKGFASSLVVEWDGPVVAAGATVPADELAMLLGLAAMM